MPMHKKTKKMSKGGATKKMYGGGMGMGGGMGGGMDNN